MRIKLLLALALGIAFGLTIPFLACGGKATPNDDECQYIADATRLASDWHDAMLENVALVEEPDLSSSEWKSDFRVQLEELKTVSRKVSELNPPKSACISAADFASATTDGASAADLILQWLDDRDPDDLDRAIELLGQSANGFEGTQASIKEFAATHEDSCP